MIRLYILYEYLVTKENDKKIFAVHPTDFVGYLMIRLYILHEYLVTKEKTNCEKPSMFC